MDLAVEDARMHRIGKGALTIHEVKLNGQRCLVSLGCGEGGCVKPFMSTDSTPHLYLFRCPDGHILSTAGGSLLALNKRADPLPARTVENRVQEGLRKATGWPVRSVRTIYMHCCLHEDR
jgi:hypothetical protein